MTLTTHVRVVDPIPADALWDFCRHLVMSGTLVPDDLPFTDEQGDEYDETTGTWIPDPQERVRRNPAGVGCRAWLWMRYGIERPLPTDAARRAHRYWLTQGDTAELPFDHFADVMFDTPYGYKAANGAGCADLHAWLVTELCQWLEERGKRYRWLQEFSGEWYDTWEDIWQLGDPIKGREELTSAS